MGEPRARQPLRVQRHLREVADDAPTERNDGATALVPRGGEAIDVADEASPDVVQTLENSFLHVLDILEIVFTGNQQSPKWAETTVRASTLLPTASASTRRHGSGCRRCG